MRTKTPAITNQYGEMNTGMPNGRAMIIPGPDSRRWGGFSAVSGGLSGVVLATLPMLRAAPDARDGPGSPRMSELCPTVTAVEQTDVVAGSPPEAPKGPALSPSRAADFMTC